MDRNTYEHHKMSPLAAGITGLILGIMGTAAIALSDKQTRTKVTKKANEVKDTLEQWSRDTLHDLQATGEDVKKRSAEKNDEMGTLQEKTEDVMRDENKKVL